MNWILAHKCLPSDGSHVHWIYFQKKPRGLTFVSLGKGIQGTFCTFQGCRKANSTDEEDAAHRSES